MSTDLKDARPALERPESRLWFGWFASDVLAVEDPAFVVMPDFDEDYGLTVSFTSATSSGQLQLHGMGHAGTARNVTFLLSAQATDPLTLADRHASACRYASR